MPEILLVNFLCTDSIEIMYFFNVGDHSGLLYSKIGRACDETLTIAVKWSKSRHKNSDLGIPGGTAPKRREHLPGTDMYLRAKFQADRFHHRVCNRSEKKKTTTNIYRSILMYGRVKTELPKYKTNFSGYS